MTQLSPTSVALTPEQLMGWGLARRLEWEQRRDRWLQGSPTPPEEQHPQLVQAFLADYELPAPAADQAWMHREAVGETDLLAPSHRHSQWRAVCERQRRPQHPR